MRYTFFDPVPCVYHFSGDLEKPFLMPIEDVFSISGRGTVAGGRAERGVAHKGDEVEIIGYGSNLKTTLTGIGMCCLVIYVLYYSIYQRRQKCSIRSWIA